MNVRWLVAALLTVALIVMIGLLAPSSGMAALFFDDGYDPGTDTVQDDYEHTTVTVVDGETGTELGSVEAAIADTLSKRYTGLSDTERLPEDRGMLFVHEGSAQHTYVMRRMSFGLDIVFIAPNGTITTIHDAPAPGPNEDGNDQRYRGRGQYILEVNRDWTATRGIEVGDEVEFDL